MLSSHGWEKAVEEEDNLAAIDRFVERFATPLLGAGADTNVIKEEFANMIEYAVQFIAISTLDYHSVWWRLFHAPNSAEWSNALILAELYSSPFQHPLESWSECSLHLLQLRLTSALASITNHWIICCY